MLWCLPALAQKADFSKDRVFSASACKADLVAFKTLLEKKHPNLYTYTAPADFNRYCDSLLGSIQAPMTSLAFYNTITLLHSKIRDGHTHIFPNPAEAAYHQAHAGFIPFQLQWLDNKLHVIKVFGFKSPIPEGAAITRINGLSAPAIRQHLQQRQMRDGYNTSYPAWIVNNWFTEYYAFHFGHPETFSIAWETERGDTSTAVLPALPKDSIAYYRQTRYHEAQSFAKTGITLKVDTNMRSAVLTIRDFHNSVLRKKYKQRFKPVVTGYFKQLRALPIEHLILDLRNNQGGDTGNGKILLSHLLNTSFQLVQGYAVVDKKNYRQPSARTKKARGPSMGHFRPRKDAYPGQLYVLINGGSFSNSGIVCSGLRAQQRAVFIGEETGGNPYLICGGGKYGTLPNTNTQILIPTLQFEIRDKTKNIGRGLLPDHTVKPTVTDLLKHRDPVLSFAYRLVGAKE